MLYVQYFVPAQYPPVTPVLDPEVSALCSGLKGVDREGASVPDSELFLQLKVMEDGASLEIRKSGQLVFVNFFCLEGTQIHSVYKVVKLIYRDHHLGKPRKPHISTWIHSIPFAQQILQEKEIELCQKMTVSFFWAVYAQHMKRSNTLN